MVDKRCTASGGEFQITEDHHSTPKGVPPRERRDSWDETSSEWQEFMGAELNVVAWLIEGDGDDDDSNLSSCL